jgi:23S rRNA (uracil1939-C5)-methyltransferase
MIARAQGRVVLVSGAIPGEQVNAEVEKVGKGVVYARTLSIGNRSADRVDSLTDPLCGGCLYSHIAYPRQLQIKAEVIADAFARIGRITLGTTIPVAASPVEGYRMRARLHVRQGRAGFFREGTHDLCDARSTRQLLPATCDVIDRLTARFRLLKADMREVEIAENIDGSERVVHVDLVAPPDRGTVQALQAIDGLIGLTTNHRLRSGDGHAATLFGRPHVTDALKIGEAVVALRRHVLAFFQGNRYLLPDLVTCVVQPLPQGSRVIDLYAGTGLFAVAAAMVRRCRVTAVESDAVAGADLDANIAQCGGAVAAIHDPVEVFTRISRPAPDAVIVDPPRTGMSSEAMEGALKLSAEMLLYVSCDVATLARDARRLADAGYALERVDAFDLFPNTPHVETVTLFRRSA